MAVFLLAHRTQLVRRIQLLQTPGSYLKNSLQEIRSKAASVHIVLRRASRLSHPFWAKKAVIMHPDDFPSPPDIPMTHPDHPQPPVDLGDIPFPLFWPKTTILGQIVTRRGHREVAI